MNYEASHSELPGYVNTLDYGSGVPSRASWVEAILPHLDRSELWDKWRKGKVRFGQVDEFICPSDPPINQSAPQLSYYANSGYVGNDDKAENSANGLFFDATRISSGAPEPADERDALNAPLIQMSFGKVRDGLNQTLMLSENVNALTWGYVLASDPTQTPDHKYHFGFCWEQPERAVPFNTLHVLEEPESFAAMTPEYGFPVSYHPEVFTVAFASGSVKMMSEKIDPLVYARLMTSDKAKSDLVDVQGKRDAEILPDDSQY